MSPDELVALCDDAIARHAAGDMFTDVPKLMLTMPYDRRKAPRGDRVHLAGRGSPLGDFMSVNVRVDPTIMVTCFEAVKVKAWVLSLMSNKAVPKRRQTKKVPRGR